MNTLDHARARWRSRRGMLELDLLLVAFVEARYGELDADAQESYGELLEFDDWTIWDWLQGRATPDPRYERIVSAIIAFAAADDGGDI